MRHKIIIILFLLIIFTGYLRKRYYYFLPTIPIYPNSYQEVVLVEKAIASRTIDDINFFEFTDYSVTYAFKPYVNESIEELQKIIYKVNPIILSLKYLINRPRPHQINENLDILKSYTAATAAYPAGHAFQAYYLSKILGKKYPQKQKIFEDVAYKCDLCRVKAGIHYPSDGKFSKYIVNILY